MGELQIGDQVVTRDSRRLGNYAGLDGVIGAFNEGEIGVLLVGKGDHLVWFYERELSRRVAGPGE